MNHYRFTEEEGCGLLEKKVPGQPDTWKEDLRVPLPDDENIATKDYVDRKVQEANPDFKGTYTSMSDIEAIENSNSNDWAYLQSKDESGNDVFSRYRFTEDGWTFEVAIKRDNFTDDEWAAITSGIDSSLVAKLEDIDVEGTVQETVADAIESLYLDEQDTGDVTIQYDDGEEEDNNN